MRTETGLGGVQRRPGRRRRLQGPGLCCSAAAKHAQIATRYLRGRGTGSGPPRSSMWASDLFPMQNATRRRRLAACSRGCASAAPTVTGGGEPARGAGLCLTTEALVTGSRDEAIVGEAAGNPGPGVRLAHTARSSGRRTGSVREANGTSIPQQAVNGHRQPVHVDTALPAATGAGQDPPPPAGIPLSHGRLCQTPRVRQTVGDTLLIISPTTGRQGAARPP